MQNFAQDHRMSCGCFGCSKDGTEAISEAAFSRRRFLCGAIGTAGLITGAVMSSSRPAVAQSALTPDQALQAMLDGNKRFTEGRLQSPNEDLSILKSKTAEKQEPFAAVLSCADSRVPVELVFDQSIGHLFVVRIAGNIATPEVTASLEYGIAVLGAKLLMVLGHSNCGAVKATIEGKAVPGQIGALYAPIWPAVNAAGDNLDAAIDVNAKIQATLLSRTSTIIAKALKDNELKVVAGRYDVASGVVSLLS
ncbi:carbonic anhydrase [Rhizobium sp. Root708]|uniref:carbonic anhydrase n=1 Tax=Rhizobium sp. Root708 TaxID=1736592 RepID=UPI0006F5D6D5|nr:carbonic anhydrase [Rhizobium sp. Root708]KRB62161.1 carbonic anhydrase [Rhizobium sp. Root708]